MYAWAKLFDGHISSVDDVPKELKFEQVRAQLLFGLVAAWVALLFKEVESLPLQLLVSPSHCQIQLILHALHPISVHSIFKYKNQHKNQNT
jgi:hypothetical protein